MPTIPYKSFCWSLGTTSFRTKNFNKTIEEQLNLLNNFWQLPENENVSWSGNNDLQTRYYDYMKQKGFVEGNANNKPKDAREKTSGLVDIGLIGDDRKLTNAGAALLDICYANDFSADNFLELPKDSYIYLKQLLKTCNSVDGEQVRPFIVLLYVLARVSSLSLDEFTYLLPLCTNAENTEEIINGIEGIRNNTATVDEIIISRLMQKDNYQAALEMLLNNDVDEALLCEIGLNRKSRQYDTVYFPLYQHLYSAYVSNDTSAFSQIFTATKDIKIGKLWRSYIFDTISEVAISRNPNEHIRNTLFSDITTEAEFKTAFFKVMHLLKAKATLSDYLDLNRRYIKTTDIVLFEDDTVKLDIVPKHFFGTVINELYTQEAIIDKDTWERVKEVKKHRRRNTATGRTSIFSGLIYCGDCGSRLYFCAAKSVKENQEFYRCSNYKENRGSCSIHFIRNVVLEKLVLKLIREAAEYITKFEPVFMYLYSKQHKLNKVNNLKIAKQEIQKNKQRIKALDKLIEAAFEKNVLGILRDNLFTRMTANYEKEQKELLQAIAKAEEMIANAEKDNIDLRAFLSIIRKCTDLKELTPELVNRLITRIEVFNSEKDENGKKHVPIKVHFIGVGILTIPDAEQILKTYDEIRNNPLNVA